MKDDNRNCFVQVSLKMPAEYPYLYNRGEFLGQKWAHVFGMSPTKVSKINNHYYAINLILFNLENRVISRQEQI